MEANDQYFPVVLISCYAVQGSSNMRLWVKSRTVAIKIKTIENYFPVVTLYYTAYGIALH